jgi:hypothetical protein
MAKRAGMARPSTARQAQLTKRTVPDGPTCRYRDPDTARQSCRAGGTMVYLSILYNLAKNM